MGQRRRPSVIARSGAGYRPLPGPAGGGWQAMATIEQARAAMSHAQAAVGIAKADNPARHPVVAEVVKG